MAAPSRTAWTAVNFNATSGSVTNASAPPQGSLVLITVSTDTASTVPVQSASTGIPGGASHLLDNIVANNGTGSSTIFSSWAFIAGASEPTSYTVALDVARFSWIELVYFTPDSGTWASVQDALDNALTSGALASTDWAKSTTSTEPTLPNLTTLGTDRRVYYAVTWDEGKTFNSAPSGTSNVYATATSTNAQRADDKTQAAAGATGTATYDISAGTRWIGMTLMVKNPSAGTNVTPTAGALTLTGFAPTLVNAALVTPAVGALALQGFAPVVAYATTLTPAVGGLALQGFAPTLVLAAKVQPDVGALALQGFAPTFTYNSTVTPGAGSLALQGFAPTILQALAVTPTPGALALAGYVPQLSYVAPVTPAPGSVTLTGYAPTILLNTGISPTTGALTLQGFSPSIGWDRGIRLVPIIGDLEPMRRILNDILTQLQRQDSYYGPDFPLTPGDGQIFVKAGVVYQWQGSSWVAL